MSSSARLPNEGNPTNPNAVMAGARAVLSAYRALNLLEGLDPGESLLASQAEDCLKLSRLIVGIGTTLLTQDHHPLSELPLEVRQRLQLVGNNPSTLTREMEWLLLNAVHLLPQAPHRAAPSLIACGSLLEQLVISRYSHELPAPVVYRFRPMNEFDHLIYNTLYALASNILPGITPQPSVPGALHWQMLIENWNLYLIRQNGTSSPPTGTNTTKEAEWTKMTVIAQEYPAASAMELCKILNVTPVLMATSIYKFTQALLKTLNTLQLHAPRQTDFEFFPPGSVTNQPELPINPDQLPAST
ncbi:hypothetical protein [Deinococcus aquiradiocola]|uniref:Uncharacterized protein n=1 Tax=Deinococcus aquiradiocola TaxID=393059 RepID=A0A917UUT3_9DEIO|nr:hypothetical protein [Deinococcus aquiradiocola]GGJ86872.1 hypothetical protein GCM10008939_33550 [Deinococcus aquiradiocola]